MIEAFEKLSLTNSDFYTQLSASQFSPQLMERAPICALDSLMLTNFKSFKGIVYVGPLLAFTSVVGPNGAGKSNVLDALMFCLCNERSKVSFYDLREFIQRDGEETYAEMERKGKFCQVEAVFLLTGGGKLTLRRTLHPNENESFAIDGEEYPQRVYEHFLLRSNLNYMTSNYAIWQGEVDKLLLKTPKQLTAHLQGISGSAHFKQDQEVLQAEVRTLEERVQVETTRLVKLRLQRRNFRKLHNTKESSDKMQSEYERILKKILMARMHLSQLQLKQIEKQHTATEAEERRRIKELNEFKARAQKEQAERVEILGKVSSLMREVAQQTTLLKAYDQAASIVDIQAFKELEGETANLNRYAQTLRTRKEELQRQQGDALPLQVSRQYLAVFSEWERQNDGMRRELAKKKNEYVFAEELLRSKRTILEEFLQKAQRSEQAEKDEQHKLSELEAQADELSRTISRMKIDHAKLTQEHTQSLQRLDDRKQVLAEIEEKLAEMEGLMMENVQNEKDKELLGKLAGVEGFKGLVEQWVRPAAKKYQLCFQIMMGPLLRYMLSADQTAAKQIAARLREQGQLRTLVILSNVTERKQQLSRPDLGKHAQLAIDAIELDKSLKNLDVFLKEHLQGKVVCENLEAAWTLLERGVRGIKEIYTLDGNVLRHDGVVSTYGSVDLLKNKYKYVTGAKSRSLILEEVQTLQKQKTSIEEYVKILKEKTNDQRIVKHNLEVARLQARKEELAATASLLRQGSKRKEVKIPRGLEGEIEELEKRVQAVKGSMAEIQKQMLNSKIFADFLKKNKVNSLDSFRSLQDLSSLQTKMRHRSKLARELEETQRQITRTTAALAVKQERLNKLGAKVNSSVSQHQKAQLAKKVKQGQEELAALRAKLSKLGTINLQALKFKSQLPQLNARLEILRERNQSMIKAQLARLGLERQPEAAEFKQLDEHLTTTLGRASKQAISQMLKNLIKQSEEIEKQLETHNLNLSNYNEESVNAEQLDRDIQALDDTLKEAHAKKAEATSRLMVVKEDRKRVFMNFFNTLKPIIVQAYQQLTEMPDGARGKVDIYLENEDSPCDQGVYFYPNPPSKRFVYDLDQLSGGEKSIASLALQYSIALASKAPFLMLDEIDAFLDNANVNRFINLVNNSVREKQLQFIVVTHKSSLFCSAQSLVGINKSQGGPFSKAYSLLLKEDALNQQ